MVLRIYTVSFTVVQEKVVLTSTLTLL